MARPSKRLTLSHTSRQSSSGSFHAGAPIPTPPILPRQPAHCYQTFSTPPPKKPVAQRSNSDAISLSEGSISDNDSGYSADTDTTPLPVRQLLLLALLSLSEQTALNSISPYLPQMVESMPGIPDDEIGFYVGLLASAFALAQLSTNFLWGYMSDIVGRKPVLMLGAFALICCFSVFGLCKEYWQIVVVHVAMGMLNGNAACVPTVLGEVTDKSNQSRAFIYLPVIYSLGGITGPAFGGLLVGKMGTKYPFLGPNVLAAVMLAVSFVAIGIWFEETLESSSKKTWNLAYLSRLFSWLPRHTYSSKSHNSSTNNGSWGARWPRSASSSQPLLSSTINEESEESEAGSQEGAEDSVKGSLEDVASWRELLNCTTITLLATYLVFQLSNISFNSLYPIFAATDPPTGRGLSPEKIGFGLSLAGFATMIFQAFIFQFVKSGLGNLGTYRIALLGIAISMVLMPWVGYINDEPLFGIGQGRTWLYLEMGFVLIIKNICAVGGLSSVMLLITNSAPSHSSLGTLNGVAQTLSALGRSIGPFASGALFTLSTNIRPKGEVLPWTIFGGLALIGWVGSLFIRRDGLESDDWAGYDDDDENAREEGSIP